eukprot:TRINITY_DN2954_c0_g1_i3.p1 TRINITY_DN2954_c0_g1~~TRINITY_DN2954_c0_g1_i3.p1  ORF type:complete len:271 (+),score=67.95 TRINITY_DN2954_c0_g1_i3:348-1160(+)
MNKQWYQRRVRGKEHYSAVFSNKIGRLLFFHNLHTFSSILINMPSVLVYGGAGQLGTELVKNFKNHGWTTLSVDFRASDSATHSIVINGSGQAEVHKVIEQLQPHGHVDAVVCVAGGWIGGAINDDKIFESVDRMLSMNLSSAIASSHIASKVLKPSSLLVLTGSAGSLNPTPGFIGYGVTKAATHHLVKSLAAKDSGLPHDSVVLGVLPITLDTPQNRAGMPGANFDEWTPLSEVSNKIFQWAEKKEVPPSGSLVVVETKEKVSKWTVV